MPLDTRQRRMSAMTPGMPWRGCLVDAAESGFSAENRRAAAFLYAFTAVIVDNTTGESITGTVTESPFSTEIAGGLELSIAAAGMDGTSISGGLGNTILSAGLEGTSISGGASISITAAGKLGTAITGGLSASIGGSGLSASIAEN